MRRNKDMIAGMAESAVKPPGRRAGELAVLAAFYCVFVFAIPRPDSIPADGWRLTGLFLATILGSILEPVPGGAVVLIAVALAPLVDRKSVV